MYDPYFQYLDQNVVFSYHGFHSLGFHSNLSEALVGGIISTYSGIQGRITFADYFHKNNPKDVYHGEFSGSFHSPSSSYCTFVGREIGKPYLFISFPTYLFGHGSKIGVLIPLS